MTIGVPHASNLTNSLPEQVTDPAFPRQLKRIIRNLYDQLDYARGTSSGRSEYLTSGTNGTLQVPNGGTGTTSGVSGGIPYYSATTLMASTALLKQNNLLLGGGATGSPATMAHPATANQYALTGTTGTAAPVWTIATSSAATGTYALRDSAGGLAMTSLTATTLTATFATFSGTVIAERLIVNGASTMGAVSMATLTGTHATLTGTLRVGGGLTVASSSTLSDVGMATLTATAATFTGTIHAQGATFSAVRSTTLTVTGASTLAAVSMATLTATAATFSGTVQGVGATFSAAVNAANLSATGASTLSAVAMATLTATAATFTGAVNAASATFSGTVRVGGGLTVATAATMAAVGMTTLTATNASLSAASLVTPLAITSGGTGATSSAAAATALGLGTGDSPTFAGVTITGTSSLAAVTISGALNAQGATFTAINASTLAVSGASTLSAVNMTTLTGTMGQLTRLGIGAAAHATAPLYINDMASGYGVLVGNATTFQQFGSDSSAWVAWARNAFLSGGQWTRLQSYAGAQLIQMTDGGDIRFMRQTDGATTSGTIISWGYAGQVDSAGRWGLGGAASATYTAYVYGNTWINGSLDSTDITSSNTLVVAGAASLSSTLVVGGGVTISGALNAASATLTGTARIGGGLTVAGASTQSAVGMATLTATAATFTGVVNLGAGFVVAGATTMAAVSCATLSVTTITSGTWNAGAITSSGAISGATGAFDSLGDQLTLKRSGVSNYWKLVVGGSGELMFRKPDDTTLLDITSAGNAVFAGTINGLTVASGTITSGVWNAGAITSSGAGQFTAGSNAAALITTQGYIDISPGGNNSYNEGIRLHPATDGYSVIAMGAVAGGTGTGVGQWNIIAYPTGDAYKLGFTYNATSVFELSAAGNATFAGGISGTTGTFSGAVSLGNTVNVVSPTAPNRTITVVCNGVTLYIHAKTTND